MKWTHLIIHHTGAEEKNARQVRDYHRRLGWRDVGYHYLIERDGLIVPGRPPSMRGAHCLAGGMNHKALGVALIGDLEARVPFPAQLAALDELVGRLLREYRIPLVNLLGHREVPGAATACPGRHLDLEALRRALKPSGPQPLYRVQVGAFRERARAEELAARLQGQGFPVWISRSS
jgi:N-acetyl-anhydromuramyl-L-alanine amidase AmpD